MDARCHAKGTLHISAVAPTGSTLTISVGPFRRPATTTTTAVVPRLLPPVPASSERTSSGLLSAATGSSSFSPQSQSLNLLSEGNGGRTLTLGMAVTGGAAAMTVEVCLDACQAAGYSLAGVEYSQECYCGDAFQFGGAPATDGCTMACKGNSAELCGGSNRLNAYTFAGSVTTPPAGNTGGGNTGGGTGNTAPTTGSGAAAGGPAPITTGLDPWEYVGCYTYVCHPCLSQDLVAHGFSVKDKAPAPWGLALRTTRP